MKKEIIVNADDLESRVAIVEDGQLAELHVERELRMVGSIYKARVMSVLPGMDAAFADVGLEKNVFLCADDVGFVSRDGVTSGGAPRSLSIAERVKENQEVVVQIVRAPVGGKGARASTRLALPGRYLVLLLYDGRQVGVSRKIEDRKERERLRKIGEKIRPEGKGLIVRTEAEGRGRKDLEADLKVLLDLRERILAKAEQTRAPALLHQDLTLTYQVIRDVFTDDVRSLVIDSKSAHDNAVELVEAIAPQLRRRVKRYRGKLPIFHKYGIEGEIDRLLRRRVWLKAGGYISIDQAEAFTAIDVNTGRYTGTTGLADTILRTNLEAADEVARQLRLRDLGGIIVIDFIDMDRPRHRQRVMKAFEEALRRDRQKTKIIHLSPLGLIEMTRKRRGESLMGILTDTCPQCAGLGRIRNALTVGMKIEREVRRIAAEDKAQAIIVRAAPRVAAIMIGEDGQRAVALEKMTGNEIYIRGDERMPLEEQEIAPTTLDHVVRDLKLHHKGDEVVVDRLDPRDPTGTEEVCGWGDGYRVQIEGAVSGAEPQTVVLAEAGHSFGKGRVKGAELVEEKKAPPRRGTRRGRGRQRKEAVEPAEAPSAAEVALATAGKPEPAPEPQPERARRRGRAPYRRGGRKKAAAQAAEAGTPPAAAMPEAPPVRDAVAAGPDGAVAEGGAKRRTGLLRRGARKKTVAPSAQAASVREVSVEPPPAVKSAATETTAPARRVGLLRRGARLIRARR
jgi:ribonuclease G